MIAVQGTATSIAGVRVLASYTGQAERAASTGKATDRLHSGRFGEILSQTFWVGNKICDDPAASNIYPYLTQNTVGMGLQFLTWAK